MVSSGPVHFPQLLVIPPQLLYLPLFPSHLILRTLLNLLKLPLDLPVPVFDLSSQTVYLFLVHSLLL